jgi:dihydrolipoamide dehydrogenase
LSANAESPNDGREEIHAQLVVLGSGPGGYTAAFRAADLGLDVVLVERHETLGGVCLNVGCIPSKALLHVAKVIAEAERARESGISFASPEVELDTLREWKRGIVTRLTTGLAGLAKRRKVRVLRGVGELLDAHTLAVDGTRVSFDHAILATGSSAVRLPGIPYEDPRVMDSTDALELLDVPERLLVIGGGIIGLELATAYDALGSRVTVVELAGQLIPGCDPDLVEPLRRRITERYDAIHLNTRVESLAAAPDGLHASLLDASGQPLAGEPGENVFDRVLVAVGRVPNSKSLGLDQAGVVVDERGFVAVDRQQRTNVEHIHAISGSV